MFTKPMAIVLAGICISANSMQVLAQLEPALNYKILQHPEKPGYRITRIKQTIFSPNGKYALIAADSTIAALWEIPSGTLIKGLGDNKSRTMVSAMSFSPDSKYALTASGDSLRLWSTSSGALIKKFTGHFYPPIDSLAFSPDGNYALSATTWEPIVRLWAIPSGTLIKEFSVGMLPVALTFSPDSKYALIALTKSGPVSEPDIVRLYSIPSFTLVKEMKANSAVLSIACSSNGQYALAGAVGETAWLWEIPSGNLIHEFKSPDTASIYRNEVVLSPDSNYMLMKTYEGKGFLWAIPSGKLIKEFKDHEKINSIAFSADSKYVFTGSDVGALGIWSLPSGKPERTIPLDKNIVTGDDPLTNYLVSVSPNGGSVITVNANFSAEARLWDISAFTMPDKDLIAPTNGATAQQSIPVDDGIKAVPGRIPLIYTTSIILALIGIIFLLLYRFFY